MRQVFARAFAALSVAAAAISAAPAGAAIVWSGAQNITGDANVSTTGALIGAYNFGQGGSVAVNGVTFVTAGGTTADNRITVSAAQNNAGSAYAGNNTGTHAGLSANYRNILDTGIYQDGSAITFTINNLTPSTQYQVQFFVNDSRDAFGNRTETLSGSTPVSLDFNTQSATAAGGEGGVGQFATGTFTTGAAETTQTFTATGDTASISSQVNAIQLRAVPEPGSIALLAVGAGALIARRRRGRA